jgi:Uma2 family endonuclease
MSTPAHRIRHTYAEYLVLEAHSNIRHEFLDGQIYAMSGGTPEHAALMGTIIRALQLPAGCRVYPSDLRVRTRSGLTTYPDTTVVCGSTERDSEDKHAITNPSLLIEVLSRATEEYDRGDKLEHYKTIPSLRQVVLVSYRRRAIDVWSRGDDGSWSHAVAREGDVAELVIGGRLDVRHIYEAAAE